MTQPPAASAVLRLARTLAVALAGFALMAGTARGQGTALSTEPGEADYPALCAAPDGGAWAAWTTYADGADQLYLARYDGAGWGAPSAVRGARGDLHAPACAVDGEGRLHLVWPRQEGGEWELWGMAYGASEPARLFRRPGADFAPRMAPTPDGGVVLVWQGWRGDNFDVFLVRNRGAGWGEPEAVTSDLANDWAPSVAVAASGRISVSWDSYRNGNYDVLLRQRGGGGWGPERAVAAGARFEANARIAVDARERVWVFYEERGERWGKDRGYVTTPGFDETNTLLGFSRVRVKVLDGDRLLQPVQPPEQLPVAREWGGDRSPTPAIGADGRIWLAVKRPHPEWMQLHSFKRQIPFAGWQQLLLSFDGDRWSDPQVVDSLRGRSDSDLELTSLPDGRVLHAWHSDHRGGRWHNLPSRNRVFAAVHAAPPVAVQSARLGPAEAGSDPGGTAAAAAERAAVGRARSYTVELAGRPHRLLRGDLHRHTDVSWDGPSEGSIGDLFRYALDAAALDFVAVTDHSPPPGIEIEYVRWRTQKLTDLFHAPDHFVPLFGYERSVPYPHGHRNVIEADRGHLPHPIARPLPADDTERLYTHLHGTGGVAIPHTTGTDHGTDWHVHDGRVEPVVELYQGTRTSYEHPGAPRADLPGSQQALETGYRPDGFVWEAWRKGYRLGVIASSDHLATHVAYANVFAAEATREGVLAAIRARHTFASTDNIVLDLRIAGGMQGDEVTVAGPPALRVRVRGTAPVRELVVFRDLRPVHHASGGAELELEWRDEEGGAGERQYYVRVEQEDGELAWSSPIWVTRR